MLFGKSDSVYDKKLKKSDKDKLEEYLSDMENLGRHHDEYIEKIKADNTLYKWQKQKKINDADKDYYRALGKIHDGREEFCKTRGIEKRKLNSDSSGIRRGKWGYK